MTALFDDPKYREAAEKAKDFIVRQMNVNNYIVFPSLRENYSEAHTDAVIAAVNMPEGATINYPTYIWCERFYDEQYTGICSGGHQNLGAAAKHMGVEVSVYTDARYRSCVCPLHNDGTWMTEQYFKETDYYGVGGVVTKTETYWYRKEKVINESGSNGIKGFTLKYYNWLDEDGTPIDVDNLPGKLVQTFHQELLTPDSLGNVPKQEFIRAETYTLKPVLVDDTIMDDAVPKYADYSASLFVFADVEYDAYTTDIYYDGVVTADNLPQSPEALPEQPSPFIKDAIVQPYAEGKVIITWIGNFTDACTITLDGQSRSVSGQAVVEGYYTFRTVMDAPLGGQYTLTITGKNGVSLTKSFATPDNRRFLIVGDPQLIGEDTAQKWYEVQSVLSPLPTLILSLGDQVDAISDSLKRAGQLTMFTAEQSVPIATIRGNHEKNDHYLAHYGFPHADGANYYFLHKGVLFIALDTENSNAQYHIDFIKKALAAETYDWSILLMHRGLYSLRKSSAGDKIGALRTELSDFIVKETDIALVLNGHEHYYARTQYPGKLFLTATTCTGAKYYVPDYLSAPWKDVVLESPTPLYTVMDVTSNQLVLTTYDFEGNTVDTVSVGR